MWHVVLNGPGYADTSFELPEGPTHLGRGEGNDIVLGGELASRRHARLVVAHGELTVEDLDSRNGTHVNGEPLRGRRTLRDGDTVSVGETRLAVAVHGPGAAEAQARRLRTALERFLPTPEAEARARTGLTHALAERPVVLLWAELDGVPEAAARAGGAAAGGVVGDFHARLARVARAHGGVVETLLGDAGRLVFGLEAAAGDDVVRALRAGLSLRSGWDGARAGRPEKERCGLRVGVHALPAWTGWAGAPGAPQPVVVGAQAGWAQAAAAQAREGQVLVTARALSLSRARFDVAPLGERPLGSGGAAAALFEVLDEDTTATGPAPGRGGGA